MAKAKVSTEDKKRLKELNAQLKTLQAQLAEAHKLEGKDAYIVVKVGKNLARGERIKKKDAPDTVLGNFYIEIEVKAKEEDVYIPLSIASGRKVAGFMYQIEGTAAGSIVTASVKVRGNGVSQVTVGTLRYAKILSGKTASFEIRAVIRGTYGKSYKIVFTRLNYKLRLADARYQQYLKEIHSKSV
jgi:hypothetical protein